MVKDEKEKKISLLQKDLTVLEEYVNDLFTFAPLPICFSSPFGILLEANPAFEKISGFDSYEIIGEEIENFFDEEKIKDLTKKTVKNGFVEAYEISLFTKEKEEISVSAFTKTRKDEKGQVTGYFLSLFNLTEIKKARKALEEAKATLEVKVKARTIELEELTQTLEEKVKERTKELQDRIDQLEKFRRLTVGRELKMAELKQELERLREEISRLKRR